jgi:hypothetical protein
MTLLIGSTAPGAFARADGNPADLVESGQGVRASGPPAALAALASAIQYLRPENSKMSEDNGGSKNFGHDEISLTLAAAGGRGFHSSTSQLNLRRFYTDSMN